MVYCVMVNAKTSNGGLKTAIEAVLVAKAHASVWPGDYVVNRWTDFMEEEGLSIVIRFHAKASRDAQSVAIKGVAGVLTACDDGSFLREYISYIDEPGMNRNVTRETYEEV